MTTDINGNLMSVVEPDPAYDNNSDPAHTKPAATAPTSAQSIDCISSLAPYQTLGTCYTYDALKNLLTVRMPRSTGTQTRTFSYQTGTSWLMSATNPENGTVTYTRDAAGHVLTRGDAKGQTTAYSYDSFSRLSQVTRAPGGNSGTNVDACQTENYTYDSSIDGFNSGSFWGKLTKVTFGNGTAGLYSVCPGVSPADSSTWGGITYRYAYDSMGSTVQKEMAISRTMYYGGLSTAHLDAYWGYDNEGRVTSETYPVVKNPNTGSSTGTVFNYTYDSMGRPINMARAPGDPAGGNAVIGSGVQYNANGQMTNVAYGGISEIRNYNQLNQVTSIQGSWGGGQFTETYNFPTGAANDGNNGQIRSVTEGTGETVLYTYDTLKRLIAASSST